MGGGPKWGLLIRHSYVSARARCEAAPRSKDLLEQIRELEAGSVATPARGAEAERKEPRS